MEDLCASDVNYCYRVWALKYSKLVNDMIIYLIEYWTVYKDPAQEPYWIQRSWPSLVGVDI